MCSRAIDCFFYGLFMDKEVLAQSKVTCKNPRAGFVNDFSLLIGSRATLARSVGAKAYGVAYEISHEDLGKLYGSAGLEEYCPEAVIVTSFEGKQFPALCYNLPSLPRVDESNSAYASKLKVVLAKLNFPPEYISAISQEKRQKG